MAYQNLDQQFIAGQWQPGRSQKMIQNLNPYTQDTIFTLQAASTADVDAAYAAADKAFQQGVIKSVEFRQQILQKLQQVIQARQDEIIDWLILESGSTRFKAGLEVGAALSIIQESQKFPEQIKTEQLESKDPQRKSLVLRKPLGVIGVISPWNFPFHLSMRSVATAIACGNSVALKPASDTPVTGGTLLGKLFEEAGLPAGVLNVVSGAGSEIGDYFVEHPIPKMISFTGSTEIGQNVGSKALASPRIKRLALELGGNAPLVILDDADLDLAVELTIMGRFMHQGQICMSTNRVIVDASVYDAYVEKLLERVKTVAVGDPNLEETIIGPIINQSQVKKHQQIIQSAKEQGAELVYEGGIEGNLVYPHIFTGVAPESPLAQEESFGPILPILKARDETHALKLANDTRFGLSSAVCTSNIERGVHFTEQLDIGMTHINSISVADQANAPFGGEKNSGLGRFNGRWIFKEFTRTHWLTVPSE
ncbi:MULTISPECIES: aldehyde dehydrogenase family protein [Acinetobacter]|uniref:aldehyde dehydrogenase family protein n=1 Tax=Acinetobacter TaxID=469 RepID=UPI0004471B6F|nr:MULTISPECIES: aldehyde dehydrogenase family protein [Acinetobacter]EXA67962.1 benzaldehyde dehydrogenase [Acinetobacter baumannii 348935]MCU4364197.1 aldehyde dehydrogenase family protein [Acinetobacter variabilis]MCU4374236.1 aldehyde dehydrogenase family protein [Acinetobacter variabilis]QKW83211.1 aldehyde dehydrogenase family protein [Acinetobacter sp. FDAARGOS_724]